MMLMPYSEKHNNCTKAVTAQKKHKDIANSVTALRSTE
jgi:hypothetical protein